MASSPTGSNIPDLVADAFTAPIGDPGPEDPDWAHEDTPGD